MAHVEDVFSTALHLQPPWHISDAKFLKGKKSLEIWIDFPSGARFPCPQCGKNDCDVSQTSQRTWRHLNFFEYQTMIHCCVPHVACPRCGTHPVLVPWAKEVSGFSPSPFP